MEEVFTYIYEKCVWGDNSNIAYNGSSGCGSTVEYNQETYVVFLKEFIKEKSIKTVVDLGCGDFQCGPIIYEDLKDVSYTGYEVYRKVVEYNKSIHPRPKYEFIHLDISKQKEEIKGGDLCILKDVLQHWSTALIIDLLDYLVHTRKFKYILLCNCYNNPYHPNMDINIGGGRSLSCDIYPLNRYATKKLYIYDTKEVSVIEVY